jgi:hyperosmotically inducible periplasmic protein
MRLMGRMLFGLVLAALLAVPNWAQEAKVGSGRYDQQIQDAVTKLLNSKDKWKELSASTEDGIVTLNGQVKLYVDKEDVGKKVDKLDHVNGVRNHLEISTTVPDSELQEKLADKLRYDRVGYGILFNNLNLQVKDGVATIGGQVHDYPSRDSAIAIAATTPGVKDVVDNIEVLPTSPMDDDIRIRVARAIYGNNVLSRYALDPQKPIRIVVNGGHVSLYGVVDNQLDRQVAVTQAKSVSGVFSVEDHLMVANEKK